METIVDTFYNKIIPGIITGKIDCGIEIRIIANVLFVENNKLIEAKSPVGNLKIPTLKINNKALLESLLVQYVDLMKDFNFPSRKFFEEDELPTYIIGCALANMTEYDYEHPEDYFNKLCYIHKNNPIKNEERNLDYNEKLKGDLSINIENDDLSQECPFVFKLLLNTELGLYEFPVIRFYIIDDTAYIGAIQSKKSNKEKTINKKVRRRLYKVNDGLHQESPLLDVDPSVVFTLSAFCEFLTNNGINNIQLLPYNLQRSNDKKLQAYYLNNMLENPQNPHRNKIIEIVHNSSLYFERLPFIRSQLQTALYRINYHFPNTVISNEDELPTINISNLEDCNNILLKELCESIKNKKTRL